MTGATISVIIVSIVILVAIGLGINETRKEIKEVDKWEPNHKKR